jgi:GNAT superfamily N-acetyltransferase
MVSSDFSEIQVRSVQLAETFPLRKSVLRPHSPKLEIRFPGDEGASTIHLGAEVEGRVVGVITAIRQPPPGSSLQSAWRLRGVAVQPEYQGAGIGRRLLTDCERRVRAASGKMIWCNARTNVIAFYEQLGFVVTSAVFEIEGIGPHVQMQKTLSSTAEIHQG